MIKFLLPGSMGKKIAIDPHTFHPVTALKQEIRDWLDTNFKPSIEFMFDGNEYCLMFNSEKELTLFLLRWADEK